MKREDLCLLVVEDDVLIRMALAEMLEDAGYGVVEAGNGLEAIAVIAGGVRIDAVVTDVDMPGGISGLDVARMVRIKDRLMPILVVSGQTRDLAAEGLHDVDFLAKPYPMQDVLECLSTRLAARAADATAGPFKLRA